MTNPTAPWHLDRLPHIVRLEESETQGRDGMRKVWTVTKYVLAALAGAVAGAIVIGATAGLPPGI